MNRWLPGFPHALLELHGVGVRKSGRVLVQDVSFSCDVGELVAVVGPSGAGKSTLLRSINRLLEEEGGYDVDGSILLAGRNVRAREVDKFFLRREVGLVLQAPVMFPGSIQGNVCVAALQHGLAKRKEAPELAHEVLERVGLWREVRDRLKDDARSLSVGQQQRLTLARTLTLKPKVLLLDEPTSALDPVSTEKVEELLLSLRPMLGMVLVTHNIGQAERLATKTCRLGSST
ncbi:MAG: phosphate ABC transporter ATP-binding protein [Silvanigrellales bacterium]|jgi:phosphate transport system ATP-binding protein|nr:phosphate ABC transporter ATP-binding protein [Silvanigrellales bacterium]